MQYTISFLSVIMVGQNQFIYVIIKEEVEPSASSQDW